MTRMLCGHHDVFLIHHEDKENTLERQIVINELKRKLMKVYKCKLSEITS